MALRQYFVCRPEMAAAEKAGTCGQRAWVRALQDKIFWVGEKFFIFFCIIAPKDKYDVVFFVKDPNHIIDKAIPTDVFVWKARAFAHSKAGI